MNWCTYAPRGQIIMTGIAGPDNTLEDFAQCGGTPLLDIPDGIGHDTHYYSGSEFVAIPIKPGQYSEWDWEAKSWRESTVLATRTVKQKRDSLLLGCDWTQLPDVPTETKTLWLAYRQGLRDITAQSGFPFTIEWPIAP